MEELSTAVVKAERDTELSSREIHAASSDEDPQPPERTLAPLVMFQILMKELTTPKGRRMLRNRKKKALAFYKL